MIHWQRDTDRGNLTSEMSKLSAAIDGIIIKHNLPFQFFEGWRCQERQDELVALGVSWTAHSKHMKGKAGDWVAKINGEWTWKPNRLYRAFGNLVKHYLGKQIIWGGDWKRRDYCHFELPD